MSNYHEFGIGKVQMIRGTTPEQAMVIAIADLEEAQDMNGPVEGEVLIPMHSSLLHFPTKEAFDRFMSHMVAFESGHKWTE